MFKIAYLKDQITPIKLYLDSESLEQTKLERC